jgi:hypothetical protein
MLLDARGASAGGSTDGEGGSGACTPRTCKDLGLECGPSGDGCGGVLECGTCTAPASCGGSGLFGICGAGIDGGTDGCTPRTCAELGFECGPAADGCGNPILGGCGTCTAPQTCGGGGQPNVCGVGAADAGSITDAGRDATLDGASSDAAMDDGGLEDATQDGSGAGNTSQDDAALPDGESSDGSASGAAPQLLTGGGGCDCSVPPGAAPASASVLLLALGGAIASVRRKGRRR